MWRNVYTALLLGTVLLWAILGCAGSDDNSEDENITIPDSAKTWADAHWEDATYFAYEFQAAQSSDESQAFLGTTSEWANFEWEDKLLYLPDNFTHEMMFEHDDTFYYNIGQYPEQFIIAWDDYDEQNGSSGNYFVYLELLGW